MLLSSHYLGQVVEVQWIFKLSLLHVNLLSCTIVDIFGNCKSGGLRYLNHTCKL